MPQKLVKPSQNKKGQKKFQLHRFLNTFSQLPAVKKYSKKGAAGIFFGHSYFDPALVDVVLGCLFTFLTFVKVCRETKAGSK